MIIQISANLSKSQKHERELVPKAVSPAGLSARIQFIPAGTPVVLTISNYSRNPVRHTPFLSL